MHHSTKCSPADIRSRADWELARLLPWKSAGRTLTAETITRALWLMATLRASLSAIASRFGFPVGLTSLRAGIASQLPDPAALGNAFARRFRALIPHVPKKGFTIALDTHWAPFYGRRGTVGSVNGRRKASTRRFFVYATAVVVEKGRRYTLGLVSVGSNRPLDALVPLLDRIAAAGIPVRLLLLDKGFYATPVFATMRARGLPYLVAVPHRRANLKGIWTRAGETTTEVGMSTRHRKGQPTQTVRVQLVRVRFPAPSKVADQVYAYHGLRPRGDLGEFCRRGYKARFGIESSYRQLNQARAKTTSKDRAWRLLLIGLSLLFRQLWVFLEQAVVGARGCVWRPETALERLRQQLANAFAETLDEFDQLDLKPKAKLFLNAKNK